MKQSLKVKISNLTTLIMLGTIALIILWFIGFIVSVTFDLNVFTSRTSEFFFSFIGFAFVLVKRLTANELTLEYLPNIGKIEKRIFVSDEPDWYLVQLENFTQNTQFETDKIVLRTKDKHQLIEKDKETIVAFFLIPNNTNLEDAKLKRTNFKFCGWAKVEWNNEQII